MGTREETEEEMEAIGEKVMDKDKECKLYYREWPTQLHVNYTEKFQITQNRLIVIYMVLLIGQILKLITRKLKMFKKMISVVNNV